MSASAATAQPASERDAEASLIVGCAVSRNLDAFDQLVGEMDAALGEGWGELSLEEALAYLGQPDADSLEFLALAIGREDEAAHDLLGRIVTAAKARGIAVVIIAADVSSGMLHALFKLGAQGFVPYPLPEGELAAAIASLPAPGGTTPAAARGGSATDDRSAVVLPAHGLAGGVGATCFAVNLAWELTQMEGAPRVCLLDLDLQFGSVGTYLDLPRREAVGEMLSEAESAESDTFMQALTPWRDRLRVLTGPPDMSPLDMLSPAGATRLIEIARTNFDYVVIDMPHAVVEWTGTVLEQSHLYFALVELDMRSAENGLRLRRAVMAEELPIQKIRWALNRAPGRMDVSGRSRLKRFADGLDVKVELLLPDGGRAVHQACDAATPLAEAARRNPLRREIARLAAQLHERNLAEPAGAKAAG